LKYRITGDKVVLNEKLYWVFLEWW